MIKQKTLLTLGFSCALAVAASAKSKPNVIFIIADDLCFNAISDLGDDNVKTPNLDRIRKSGAYFSHAFNQGSYAGAVSMASRAMLNTGKYLWRATNALGGKTTLPQPKNWPAGVAPYAAKATPLDSYWSEYMREAGYKTYMAGKWHVASSAAPKLFDVTKHVRAGMPKTMSSAYAVKNNPEVGRKFIEGVEDAWNAADTSLGGFWEGGKHWSEVLADDALGFIKDATSQNKPYFMYLGFNAPHDPRQSPQEYLDMYPAKDITVPKNFAEEHPNYKAIGCDIRDENLLPRPRTEYSVQVSRREYYALTTHMDTQIGIMLDALEKAGQMDNTYIIFTADHGLSLGNHGLAGKQNMYDEALRVPLLVSGPGIKPCVIDDLVYLQDAMATAMEIAGVDPTGKVDFKSLLSLAQGSKKSPAQNEAVYAAYMGLQRMVRTNKYKMIIFPTVNEVLLFDVEKDPKEMTNLASDPKFRKVADDLFAKLQKLQVEMDDQLDLTPFYTKFYSK